MILPSLVTRPVDLHRRQKPSPISASLDCNLAISLSDFPVPKGPIGVRKIAVYFAEHFGHFAAEFYGKEQGQMHR